jgi:hypothetical protein
LDPPSLTRQSPYYPISSINNEGKLNRWCNITHTHTHRRIHYKKRSEGQQRSREDIGGRAPKTEKGPREGQQEKRRRGKERRIRKGNIHVFFKKTVVSGNECLFRNFFGRALAATRAFKIKNEKLVRRIFENPSATVFCIRQMFETLKAKLY